MRVPGIRRGRNGLRAGDNRSVEGGVRFGSHRFELATGRLWSGKRELRLTPKAAAVLGVLVTQAGSPVAREELFATVWKGIAVGDDALTTCIQELRRALGDDSRRPRFIETRHRRGYRFIAPLTEATRAEPADAPAADVSAVAVLPFTDLSPGRDQEHFCAGLAEELIDALGQIERLRVASRTASFQFRAEAADVREVGRRLGVGALLAGSVRKSGDRLRVTVELVDVATGYHRWSRRFDRKLDDVFAIQDEIATSVAASLRGRVLNRQEKQALLRPQTRAEAYDYYLRARQLLPLRSHAELERSGELFARAIELDASYGPAWAGLATVRATLFEWFGAQDGDLAAAERASRRALELAPELAESHVARGLALSLSRRYDEAASAFEEAIRLNPGLFDAHHYFARISFASGRTERAAELFARAAALRQEDFQSPILLALALRVLGRSEEARQAGREGVARAERALMLNPLDCRALSLGACALFSDGQTVRAQEWSRQALELYPDDLSALANGACLHARAGRKEAALDLLERVFGRGWGKRDWVERDPDYDLLRDDPRFQQLFARLK